MVEWKERPLMDFQDFLEEVKREKKTEDVNGKQGAFSLDEKGEERERESEFLEEQELFSDSELEDYFYFFELFSTPKGVR